MTELSGIAHEIWNDKYRFKAPDGTPIDQTVDDTWNRVATALAEAEKPSERAEWKLKFFEQLSAFKFLPGGRIIAGLGTGRSVTALNCLSGNARLITEEYGPTALRDVAGKVVTVLTKAGWKRATVRKFGLRQLNKIILQPVFAHPVSGWHKASRSKFARIVRATPDHRWILHGDHVTTSLKVGDIVESCAHSADKLSKAYMEGLRHGIIFGDGSHGKKTRIGSVHGKRTHHSHSVRLCGHKADLLPVFGQPAKGQVAVTYSPSCKGDPIVTFYADTNLKELPSVGLAPDYYAGFIQGWLATDGSIPKGGSPFITIQNADAVQWLLDYAATGGWVVVGHTTPYTMHTNYGKRSAELHLVRLRKADGIKWRVVDIAPAKRAQTYCAVVPEVHAFALANGVYTGNCYVQGNIADKLRGPGGIMERLAESAYTMQQGAGIGNNFSTLRPRGALIEGLGVGASGPISFMKQWDSMCASIMSAGHRRGAMMGTLLVSHPDIEEFIAAKRKGGTLTNFNLSVLITDEFMSAVENGKQFALTFAGKVYKQVDARALWETIMRSTYESADPGVLFIDRINEKNPLNYVETITSTNPCFTGDTFVWTAYGPKRFDELAKIGATVPVLTQFEDGRLAYRDMIKPRMTRKKARLVEVTFYGEGRRRTTTTVRCTPNHEFFLRSGVKCRADELQPGDRIASVYRYKANVERMKLAGTYESVLEHHVACEYQNGRRPRYPDEHAHHKDENKQNNDPKNIEILPGSEHNALKMWGDRNPMRRMPEKNHFRKGHPNYYDVSGSGNGRYRHDIDDEAIRTMREVGLTMAAIAEKANCSVWTVKKRLGCPNHRVVSVRQLDVVEDVYCGTVKETGRFFVASGKDEGVLVSNCGEQPLPEFGCCCLGSLNLTQFVRDPFTINAKWDMNAMLRTAHVAVRMLDNVLDLSNYPLEEQRKESQAKRRIGIGITGLADAFAMLGIKYSDGAKEAGVITSAINYACREASEQLGEERGSFPLFDATQYGVKHRRNSHVTSIAPTGTISMLAGNVSSGIEPIFDLKAKRKVLQPDGTRKELVVEDYAYGMCARLGQEPGAALWQTTAMLTPDDHLAIVAACAPHVDSAISKTINCPVDIPYEQFAGIYMKAFDLGLKGCTTYRPNDITGSILSSDTMQTKEALQLAAAGTVVEMVKPMQRPDALVGTTYKIKPGDHALYVTITNAEINGRLRPFEIFINTKNLEHHVWLTALTRMVSAIFRKGGDVSFVIEELGAVYDPRGGYWADNKFYASICAGLGAVIERHLQALDMPVAPMKAAVLHCPKCQTGKLIMQEGCNHCDSCSYSKCG